MIKNRCSPIVLDSDLDKSLLDDGLGDSLRDPENKKSGEAQPAVERAKAQPEKDIRDKYPRKQELIQHLSQINLLCQYQSSNESQAYKAMRLIDKIIKNISIIQDHFFSDALLDRLSDILKQQEYTSPETCSNICPALSILLEDAKSCTRKHEEVKITDILTKDIRDKYPRKQELIQHLSEIYDLCYQCRSGNKLQYEAIRLIYNNCLGIIKIISIIQDGIINHSFSDALLNRLFVILEQQEYRAPQTYGNISFSLSVLLEDAKSCAKKHEEVKITDIPTEDPNAILLPLLKQYLMQHLMQRDLKSIDIEQWRKNVIGNLAATTSEQPHGEAKKSSHQEDSGLGINASSATNTTKENSINRESATQFYEILLQSCQEADFNDFYHVFSSLVIFCDVLNRDGRTAIKETEEATIKRKLKTILTCRREVEKTEEVCNKAIRLKNKFELEVKEKFSLDQIGNYVTLGNLRHFYTEFVTKDHVFFTSEIKIDKSFENLIDEIGTTLRKLQNIMICLEKNEGLENTPKQHAAKTPSAVIPNAGLSTIPLDENIYQAAYLAN